MKNEFEVTSDYNSHRPLLYAAASYPEIEKVVELGCGYGSTCILTVFCERAGLKFRSYETNVEWAEKLHPLVLVTDDYFGFEFDKQTMLFIDSKPGEDRKDLINYYARKAGIIVVHDTEPGAEYVYHMKEVLSIFPYRCDLHIPAHPSTTAVSMWHDITHLLDDTPTSNN